MRTGTHLLSVGEGPEPPAAVALDLPSPSVTTATMVPLPAASVLWRRRWCYSASATKTATSVEEAECRRAYDFAGDTYNSSFDYKKPAEEDALRQAHERAMNKAITVFNASAFGAGSARSKFEKLLQTTLRKRFESMESRVWAACNCPDSKLDDVVRLLDGLLTEYEVTSYGPKKWTKLVTFLHQCL